MQVSTKFTIALHILIAVKYFEEELKKQSVEEVYERMGKG